MKRKVIQIMCYDSGSDDAYLVALCDDGTIWKRVWDDHNRRMAWEQIPTTDIRDAK